MGQNCPAMMKTVSVVCSSMMAVAMLPVATTGIYQQARDQMPPIINRVSGLAAWLLLLPVVVVTTGDWLTTCCWWSPPTSGGVSWHLWLPSVFVSAYLTMKYVVCPAWRVSRPPTPPHRPEYGDNAAPDPAPLPPLCLLTQRAVTQNF